MAKGKSRQLLCGVLKAAKVSDESRKYAQLIWRLGQLGGIKLPSGKFEEMDMNRKKPGLASSIDGCRVSEDWCEADVHLVLMCPKRCDRHSEAPYSEFYLMYFNELAEIIKKSQQPFASDFAGYLCKWAKQRAGYAPTQPSILSTSALRPARGVTLIETEFEELPAGRRHSPTPLHPTCP